MAEKPEDLNLPNSVIARIIKEALPEGVIISKESRSAISKAASVFVLYCTSCANNYALQQKRKTLKDVDVLAALEEMEFENFVPQLKQFLEAFKLEQKGKKTALEKRRKAKESSVNTPELTSDVEKADAAGIGAEMGDLDELLVMDTDDGANNKFEPINSN
ncbi:DNA polymerase epsilon subunit 3-like [Clavelina lepadiformis]|uniref:DNA polymerase epsilon subunit 3-like n=1 Tax=Clavelina lepadiformis TaxID=159417 RepID=UPI00404221C8